MFSQTNGWKSTHLLHTNSGGGCPDTGWWSQGEVGKECFEEDVGFLESAHDPAQQSSRREGERGWAWSAWHLLPRHWRESPQGSGQSRGEKEDEAPGAQAQRGG